MQTGCSRGGIHSPCGTSLRPFPEPGGWIDLGFKQAKRISVMATCHVIGVLQRMTLRLAEATERKVTAASARGRGSDRGYGGRFRVSKGATHIRASESKTSRSEATTGPEETLW